MQYEIKLAGLRQSQSAAVDHNNTFDHSAKTSKPLTTKSAKSGNLVITGGSVARMHD